MDYYKVLGVSESASIAEIKTAFRTQSKIYHPDIAGDNADAKIRYDDIRKAYEILSNPVLRYAYHEQRWLQKAHGTHKANYTANTAANIYKSLVQLEQSVHFWDAQRDNTQLLANNVSEIMNAENIKTINAKNDAQLNNMIAQYLIKLMPELPTNYLTTLHSKIFCLTGIDTPALQTQYSKALRSHNQQQAIQKYKWIAALLLLTLLLFLLAL